MNKWIETLEAPWTPFPIEDPGALPHGDMPGDKIQICQQQVEKLAVLFPALEKELAKTFRAGGNKAVVALCGGSGSGKSGMAALLGHCLRQLGMGVYILSGDNYPRRIPCQNDAERLRIFRCSGIRGLLTAGLYSETVRTELEALQTAEQDSDPALRGQYPWLAVYQNAGADGLTGYLGTPQEQDFDELSRILGQFKNGQSTLWLKRMGRTETALWYEEVDVSETQVLIVEWTHSNNSCLQGVDIPILLNSTPQETLEYRRSRNRDGGVDSPFVSMVLEIEQRLLDSQAHRAKIILSKQGELLDYRQYRKLMAE